MEFEWQTHQNPQNDGAELRGSDDSAACACTL